MIRTDIQGDRAMGPLSTDEFDARLATALATPGSRGEALMSALLDTPVVGEITPEEALLAAIEGVEAPRRAALTLLDDGPRYDDTLDPISPNFNLASWSAQAERVQGTLNTSEGIAAAKARLTERLAGIKAEIREERR